MVTNDKLISLLKDDFSYLNLGIETLNDTIYAKTMLYHVSRCDFNGVYEIYLNETGFCTISLTIKAPLGIKPHEYEEFFKHLQETEDTLGTFTINAHDEMVLVWLDEHNETVDEFKNFILGTLEEIKKLKLQ